MTTRQCLTAGMALLMIWITPLIALGTGDVADHKKQIWHLAELEQKRLEQSVEMLHDEAMERCLQTVAMRLWKQVNTSLNPPVVKVMIDTRAEAVTYPNGYVLLTTGMLGQIQSEDQLAIILGHELIHYARQHTIQLYDQLWFSAQAKRLRPAGSNATRIESDVAHKVQAAEDQADKEGFAIFKAAGYREAQIPLLFSTIIDHIGAQGHPKDLEAMVARKKRMQAMIGHTATVENGPAKADGSRQFLLSCIAPALMANAQTAIQRGEWRLASQCITACIAIKPDDARAYYLQGEIMRQQENNSNTDQIMAYYEKALTIDPQFPSVHRALGELHFKAGQYGQAKPYFETFLSLAPTDESKTFIEGYLNQCQK
jgi:beta-barrel assembly-enhancing protease